MDIGPFDPLPKGSAATAERGFAVSLAAPPPPIPGVGAAQPGPDQLESRLWSLLLAAGCHIIPPPSQVPDPSLTDAFQAIVDAAGAFDVVPGVELSEVLWTRPGAYWDGTVAQTLHEIDRRLGGPVAQGFLLLHAKDVDDRTVYFRHANPLVLTDRLYQRGLAVGPFIALVVCRLDGQGNAEAVRGAALPVLSVRRLVPLNSLLQRDVLTVLIELQEKLDVFGIEVEIERKVAETEPGTANEIELTIRRQDGTIQVLRLRVGQPESLSNTPDEHDVYVVTTSSFLDGSFVRWIERVVLDRGGDGALDAAIARGLADTDNGRTAPAEDVFDRLAAKYGSSDDLSST
ncbi:MAG: hypothetical protein JHC57_07905 [Sphingopyxis sp.]|uniref:hypothetical protein n=1 Tax=Sphingopyxis sp. TaxID=1908224 RepID=UPI001A2EBD04|nr:hypothetical protein [Sphingopyxis sp.]MBJ7499660.1 hypothetical protein [Sphingopyxis sp.]